MNEYTTRRAISAAMAICLTLLGCGGGGNDGGGSPTAPSPPAAVQSPAVYLNVGPDSILQKFVISFDNETRAETRARLGEGWLNAIAGSSSRMTKGSHHISLEADPPGGEYLITFYGGLPGNTGGVRPNSLTVPYNDDLSTITVYPCSVNVAYKRTADIEVHFDVIIADYSQVCR